MIYSLTTQLTQLDMLWIAFRIVVLRNDLQHNGCRLKTDYRCELLSEL